jgi:hypothetical protein
MTVMPSIFFKATKEPAVEGKVTAGKESPIRCLAAPSSIGAGKFVGNDVKSLMTEAPLLQSYHGSCIELYNIDDYRKSISASDSQNTFAHCFE